MFFLCQSPRPARGTPTLTRGATRQRVSDPLPRLGPRATQLTKDVVDSLKVLVEDVAAVNAEGGAEVRVTTH